MARLEDLASSLMAAETEAVELRQQLDDAQSSDGHPMCDQSLDTNGLCEAMHQGEASSAYPLCSLSLSFG